MRSWHCRYDKISFGFALLAIRFLQLVILCSKDTCSSTSQKFGHVDLPVYVVQCMMVGEGVLEDTDGQFIQSPILWRFSWSFL